MGHNFASAGSKQERALYPARFPLCFLYLYVRMRLLGLSILLLAAPGVKAAAYTLDQVEAQFSSYLQLAENGWLSTRGQLPFGCTLAVRKPSALCRSHRLTHPSAAF